MSQRQTAWRTSYYVPNTRNPTSAAHICPPTRNKVLLAWAIVLIEILTCVLILLASHTF